MNFVVANSDNSFYFTFYNDSFQNVKLPSIPLEERKDGKIDFADFIETEFRRQKLSIHESGYIHSKNKEGEILKKEVIGFPFDKIEISKLILICGPTKITELEKIVEPRNKTDIVISLPDNISPFTLHFDIYRKSKESELDFYNPDLLFGGYILRSQDEKDFGLRIYGQSVKGNAIWPPFNLILTRLS
jgi:hypothetical protein